MVVLAVTWVAKAGHEVEVAELFSRLTEESRKEPGCVMYQVHRHRTEPRRFFIYEQYQDDAAREAHRNAPHFRSTRRKNYRRSRIEWKDICTSRSDKVRCAFSSSKRSRIIGSSVESSGVER